MLSTLFTVLPVFGLILAGWAARRFGALGPTALREINRFVVYLALPVLMFDVIAGASLEEIWQPGFILAYSTGCFVVFFVTLFIRVWQKVKLADAAVDGLSSSYSNTAYMGFPLMLAVYGQPGLMPAVIASVITITVIFCIGLIIIESALQTEGSALKIARVTTVKLFTNPLFIAPVLGTVFLLAGISVPAPAQSFIDLLGAAASPCALVAIGLFFADAGAKEDAAPVRIIDITWLTGLKLFAQPFITWVVAGPILNLPPFLLHSAVFIAAMPTGTGPFMLAEFYERNARIPGQVVLISTVVSVVTLTLYLRLFIGG